MKASSLRLSLLLAASCTAMVASAQSVLSNLSGSYTPFNNTTIFSGTVKAVGLTTGASPLSLVSIGTLMTSQTGLAPQTFTAGVYSNLNSAPNVQLAGFTSATVTSTTAAVFTLTPLAPYILAPNTTYWFVVSSDSNDVDLNWNGLSPNTAPTATGVSYVGYRRSSDSGASWATSSVFNGVDIRAQAVPEPATMVALGIGVSAMLRRRKRSWVQVER